MTKARKSSAKVLLFCLAASCHSTREQTDAKPSSSSASSAATASAIAIASAAHGATPKASANAAASASAPRVDDYIKPLAKGPFAISNDPALINPKLATRQAPPKFSAVFGTTAGDFQVQCERAWAPHGVDRFFELVRMGFFHDAAFFRAVSGKLVQFGLHSHPKVIAAWERATILADKRTHKNTRGTLSFAMSSGNPGTRATQVFINLSDNPEFDRQGFVPICEVSKGMENVDTVFMGYGEHPTEAQSSIRANGNLYLRQQFPQLDYIARTQLLLE